MRNTAETYGWMAVLLHWLMAILTLGLFALGFYMVELTYYDRLYNSLPYIHKSAGMMQALIFVFWLAWRLHNPRPRTLAASTREQWLAKLAHRILLLLIAVTLFSGYLIPTADGSPIQVFDLFRVPATITSIPQQEDLAGLLHKILAYSLLALAGLHATAALKHHFINKDETLKRMLGSAKKERL